MSYILEALKKSDQERNRGETPGLQTVHTLVVQESKKRYWWIYLLVLALFVNAGLLLWWLQPWKSSSSKLGHLSGQQQTAPAENQTSNQTSKPAGKDMAAVASPAENQAVHSESSGEDKKEQQIPAPQNKMAISEEQSPPAAQDKSSTTIHIEPTEKAAAPPGTTEPAVKKSETPATQVPRPSQTGQTASSPAPKITITQKDTKPVERRKEKPPESAKPAQDKPDSKPDGTNAAPAERLAELHAKALDEALTSKPKPAQPDIEPHDTPSQKDQLPSLKSLPIEVQKEIPELTLSFLVYADKPDERMVNVNGQMMREGQEVAPDLKIEQITPEGAVFSYKGLRFKKGVL